MQDSTNKNLNPKNNNYSFDQIKDAVESKLKRYYGIAPSEATEEQIYRSVVLTVKDILMRKRADQHNTIKKTRSKRIYYMCMEFLIGRSLKNNLCNLGLDDEYRQLLSEYGFDIDKIYEIESDAALGNGGLGRLAACFMDSLTTLGYSATGFSICYEFGLFRQKIVDGMQVELPDEWLPTGESWLVPRSDKAYTVRFGGTISEKWENGKLNIVYENYDEVRAVPYDLMVSGADTEACNYLRLWKAHSVTNFNMSLFSQGQYVKAMEQNTNTEIISKVLYPSDNHDEGKLLRLNQQYFLCSASLQSIISDHLAAYGTLDNLTEKVAIHLNDTHPALCIPELMRILMDSYSYSWDRAWETCLGVFSYTNHTVMPEALEQWKEDLFRFHLPRIHTILTEINRRFCADLWNLYPGDWDRISKMAVIADNRIRMANLSIVGSHTVNGVSKLHSDILKEDVFRNFYKKEPEKFMNVTNGIAHRRWLCYSNPKLAALLDECIGPDYRKNPEKLEEFLKYKDDATVLKQLEDIKYANKVRFADYVKNRTGVVLDPASVFDVQIKRLHEYKRQLLNALRIISLYNDLLENPNLDITPQTFIFGAKAAPGYDMAKNIIKLIWSVSQEIEKNPKIREKLRVVFMEDYNVSVAEVLIPSADISEQISLAGKEASGTGNMKFMINGALTCGTLDGANVEMHELLGDDNIYIFGLTAQEVEDMWKRGYHAGDYYRVNNRIRQTVDRLSLGFNGTSFANMLHYLIIGNGVADPYMCLADFESYFQTHETMLEDYADRDKWNRKALINIAKAGFFAADRSIREYADNIWHIKPVY
ncbi:MAG: glycogen/starch/alpha-glucan phosphorylase [Ruminococcaceae bacterium]|nr:glycogen/starch/alpha-glucan phosphorylase [Oscillospiraceae bacterium]